MRAESELRDVTNEVALGDAAQVADAADRILRKCFGPRQFDSDLVRRAFAFADRLFAGREPGHLACDMPYHDLRHSLDTALIMARLVDGWQSVHRDATGALTPEQGVLGVVLALLHDTGYLRTSSEAALCGPQLMREHEARGIAFAGAWLRTTPLSAHAPLAALIDATRLAAHPEDVFAGHVGAAVTLGHMLGSADLLSQVADRWYLERCYYHLYPELVLGAGDRLRTPSGGVTLLYRDAADLVRKTGAFYDKVVRRRLDQAFADVARYLGVHFGGVDPYAAATQRNLARLADVSADDRMHLLEREPPTTTRDLAAIYHAVPPAPPRIH